MKLRTVNMFDPDYQIRMPDKTVVVTGANSGLGKEVAKDFAKRGARVVMACRNIKKTEEARNEIICETKNSNVVIRQLDLASFKSIRIFAKLLIETEPQIDIFVHNAGVALTVEKMVTEDGLDMTMGTNHFGMFLLTNLLIDYLKKMRSCRIIVVASSMHNLSRLNPTKDSSLNPVGILPSFHYSNSKFANILFTIELAKRLKAANITNVTVNCLHPGVVRTEIWRHFMCSPLFLPLKLFAFLFLKTLRQGIQTILHCALSPEVEGVSGKYFVDCQIKKPHIKVNNVIWQENLWQRSMQLVKLTVDDPKI